jgi:AcrR family transcriptional regulator
VLLNQVVLRRYLEETAALATAAIREATDAALTHIEQLAEAQAHWLEQVSLKDRASFLEDQKALHDAWEADMEALFDGQNTALQRVVERTAAQLRLARTQGTAPAASKTLPLAMSSPGRPRDPRLPKGLYFGSRRRCRRNGPNLVGVCFTFGGWRRIVLMQHPATAPGPGNPLS